MKYALDEDGEMVEVTENSMSDQIAKIGYVFYYPELNSCQVIESDPKACATQRDELEQFEGWICKVLYIMNEQKVLKASSKNESFMAE